jgi:hypothetical protein
MQFPAVVGIEGLARQSWRGLITLGTACSPRTGTCDPDEPNRARAYHGAGRERVGSTPVTQIVTSTVDMSELARFVKTILG